MACPIRLWNNGQPPGLFPQPPVLVLDQPNVLKAHTAECWQAIEEGYLRHEDRTRPESLPTPDQLYVTWDQILAATPTMPPSRLSR